MNKNYPVVKCDGKDEAGEYIYRKCITVKGKRICRPNGKAFKIYIRNKQ